MEFNTYINDESEIKYLKENLMESKSTEYSSQKDSPKNELTPIDRQILNEDKGSMFEENVRCTLIHEFNFKQTNLPRHIYFREIEINKENVIVQLGKDESVESKEKLHIFHLNSDYSLNITIKGENYDEMINIKNENVVEKIDEELIIKAKKAQKIEIDGIFTVDNFNYNMFDPNEVAILHNNVPEEDLKSYKHI